MAVNAAVAAWDVDPYGSHRYGSCDDIPWILQSALIYSELQQGEPVMENNAASLMTHLALSAAARTVYSVSLQFLPRVNSASAGAVAYMIGVHKASNDRVFFFDPDRGLFECHSSGDFFRATQYLANIFTGAASANSMQLSKQLQ